MSTPNRITRSLITVAALTALSGSMALAQYRVNNANPLDANKRVGSGGVNEVDNKLNPWEISNAIVNGNVSGGREFHGNVQTGDSFAFRGGPVGDTVSDRFIRGSTGVNTNGTISNNSNGGNLYFGSSRAAPISPNVAQSGVTLQPLQNGAFGTPQPQNWNQIDQRQQTAGTVTTTFGQTNLAGAGPVDLGYAPNAISLSPSANVHSLDPSILSDYTTVSNLSPQQVSAIRGSMISNNVQNPNGLQDAKSLTGQQNQNDPTQGTQSQSGPINDAIPSNNLQNAKPLNDGSPDDAISSPSVSNALPSAQSAEPGMVSRVIGKGADNSQPSMYDSLAQRRAEQEQALRPGQAAEQASQSFNQQLKARKDAEAKKAGNDQPAPGAKPGQPNGQAAKPNMPQPLKMNSLTAPSDNSGVGNLMTKAQQQMRDGKFASAIDSYDAAESLQPKNGLIKLGRANAELGGSYYRRAEVDLRQTLSADKNLLAGQYDLRAFLGEDRLQIIQKDLNDQVQNKPNDTGSAVLLAYVYYNTGNERRAAAMLDLADKRAGGKDEFITLLKSNWNFGSDNK